MTTFISQNSGKLFIAFDKSALCLCPAPQVRPYHASTWVHLNTHFEHERYLEAVLHRGTKWKADVKHEHPVSKAFLDSLLVDGATKEEIRDLIAEFGAKKRRRKEKAVSTARGSRKRKAAVLGLDEDSDDEMGEEFVVEDDSEGLSNEGYSNLSKKDWGDGYIGGFLLITHRLENGGMNLDMVLSWRHLNWSWAVDLQRSSSPNTILLDLNSDPLLLLPAPSHT